MGKLNNKVAIVTGSASCGFGRATARLLAQEGAKTVVADWNREGGEETVKLIQDAGGDSIFVYTDVSKSSDVKNMVKKTIDTFGKVDILVNNAGVGGELLPLAEQTEETWDRIVDINMKGVFLGMRYGISEMLKTGGGAIVNTSSAVAVWPASKSAIYGASKAGIIVLTKTAALQYASKNIRINCICPAAIRPSGFQTNRQTKEEDEEFNKRFTSRIPMQRTGKVDEAAKVILFLVTEESSYMTGAILPVDGGALSGEVM